MKTKRASSIAALDARLCVSCGSCEKVCPRAAIRVYKGVYARVDAALCIGCRKCVAACPASIIHMQEVASL